MKEDWFKLENTNEIITPSLVVFPKRILHNIKLMIEIAGGTESLRPHIKTHKMSEIIKMQIDNGINKFKCATITEAELLAKSGAKDILLAIQPTGKNISRFISLIEIYPESIFSTIVDNEYSLNEINNRAKEKKISVSIWLDINNGMNRTGVEPNNEACNIFQKIASASNLNAKGLHVYDGHIRESDYSVRKHLCDNAFSHVLNLKKNIEKKGILIDKIVAGGTPTFPIHAERENVEVSPGTSLLWDDRYGTAFEDLKFIHSAVLIGSIISKPSKDLLCINLGHKSVASEMDFPRLSFLNLKNTEQIGHSEEHMVVKCNESDKYPVGMICYSIPSHICPTVPKFSKVLTVDEGEVIGEWKVSARDNMI
tara:strand:+ start:1342 stop:2445 length:1104 start_codon:yes stop_codon:yes gene_type:complete